MKKVDKRLTSYLTDCFNRGITPVSPETYSEAPDAFITHRKFVMQSNINLAKSKCRRAKGRIENAAKILTPEGRMERSFYSRPYANKVKSSDWRWGCSGFSPKCLKGEKHSFSGHRESGNPYEGGDVISRCDKCKIYRYYSEDGAVFYPPNHKVHIRTIQDDMRAAGIENVQSIPRQILFMEGYQGPEQIKGLEERFGPEDKW